MMIMIMIIEIQYSASPARVGPALALEEFFFSICSEAATLIHRAAAPGTAMASVMWTTVAECHMSPAAAATSMLEMQSARSVHTDSGDM